MCAGILMSASAQTYTQRIQQRTAGKGTVTIHQSSDIDQLVNEAILTARTAPAATMPTTTSPTAPTTTNKPTTAATANATTANTNTSPEFSTSDPSDMPVDNTKKIMKGYKVNGYRVQAFAGGNTRKDRIQAEQTRVQDMSDALTGCFDAVVSNPPFFIDALQAPDHQRDIARHAETLTYADLMKAAVRLLHEAGELSVVIPFDYRRRMDDEAIFQGLFPCRVCAVRTTPTKPVRRYLLAYRKHPCRCEQTEMVIGDSQYQLLTQDFYL
jgi:hypothetical protein